ncbi:MAG: 50S ribosomal protein L21 [Acidobacteriia bacterium]|jgi:large subunit ribosomal protein L21|nr:50S ribosomal protein L21 [Terriglobia bacterium]
MYAVIRSGGKQYKVAPGEVVRVEKLEQKLGDEVEFNQVLIVHDDKIGTIGKPLVEKAVVSGMVVELGRAKKVKVLKYKRRKQYRRLLGHRQSYTAVQINSIKV